MKMKTTVDTSGFVYISEQGKNQLKDWFGNALTFSEFDEYWWVESSHKMIEVSPDVLLDIVYGETFDVKLTQGNNRRMCMVVSLRY